MLRKMRLPQDIDIVGETAIASFQYPENPEWGIQGEEQEQIRDMLGNMKRFWPLLALLRLVSPTFRDILLGDLWEEAGEVAGVSMYQRRRQGLYYISSISVLPEFRRRGIARKLLNTILEDARAQGGKKVMLDVISENFPAYRLYEKLGFEHFSGTIHLVYDKKEHIDLLPLPEAYELVELTPRDWRAAYELAKRVTPGNVQRYRPVIESNYRKPFAMRVLAPFMGVRQGRAALRHLESGQIAAAGVYQYRTRPGGVNEISLRCDPAHEAAGQFLICWLARQAQVSAPGRKLEVSVPTWLESLAGYARATGFVDRYTYHTMALMLGPA